MEYPHISSYIYIYMYIYIWWNMGYIWINPHFEWDYIRLYGSWDELRVIYIYDKSRIRFVGCPAPRTVESLETRRENFALALAGQLSVFLCRTSERSDLSETELTQICMGFHVQLILYIYIFTHVTVFLHVYVHIYIYIYTYMCVLWHTHTHIHITYTVSFTYNIRFSENGTELGGTRKKTGGPRIEVHHKQ